MSNLSNKVRPPLAWAIVLTEEGVTPELASVCRHCHGAADHLEALTRDLCAAEEAAGKAREHNAWLIAELQQAKDQFTHEFTEARRTKRFGDVLTAARKRYETLKVELLTHQQTMLPELNAARRALAGELREVRFVHVAHNLLDAETFSMIWDEVLCRLDAHRD